MVGKTRRGVLIPGYFEPCIFLSDIRDTGSILGWEDPLEEGMATHSSLLAWKIHMDSRAWQATVHGIAESDMTEVT